MKKNKQVSSEKTYFSCLNIYESNTTYDLDQGSVEDAYSKFARKPGSILLTRYRILEVLKENTFGFIYLVERINKNTKYIIKEFFPHEYVTRNDKEEMILNTPLDIDSLIRFNYLQNFFMGEANNLEKISIRPHSNIIKVASIEKNKNNTTYIIYPFQEGMTLYRYMEIKARMGKQKIDYRGLNKIFESLIDAVEHLHTLGIYHLNIKPENILIKEDGSLLLLGFESSTFFKDEDSRVFCNAYTLAYAAPEQISVNAFENIGAESDIYAIGTLLYRMLTGIHPPDAKERMSCKRKSVEYDPYISLQEDKELLETYSFSFLAAIDKAMLLSVKDRFKDVKSFKNALFMIPTVKEESSLDNKKYLLVYFALSLVLIYIIFKGLSMIGNDEPVVVTDHEEIVEVEKSISLNERKNESLDSNKKIRSVDDNNIEVDEEEIKEISLDINTSEDLEEIVENGDSLKRKNKQEILADKVIEKVSIVSTVNEIEVDKNETVLIQKTKNKKQKNKEIEKVSTNDVKTDQNETILINTMKKNQTKRKEKKSNPILKTNKITKKVTNKTAKKILKKRKKRVIRKQKIKKKTRIQSKKRTVKSSSGLVWYCKAIGGNIRASARNSDKARSKSMALSQCRRRAGSQKHCRILNCFLVR